MLLPQWALQRKSEEKRWADDMAQLRYGGHYFSLAAPFCIVKCMIVPTRLWQYLQPGKANVGRGKGSPRLAGAHAFYFTLLFCV